MMRFWFFLSGSDRTAEGCLASVLIIIADLTFLVSTIVDNETMRFRFKRGSSSPFFISTTQENLLFSNAHQSI